MRPSLVIAIAAALAFGTASFASTVSAAELSKDELILKLLHGKHAGKTGAGGASATSQGQAQMLVIDPGAVKRKTVPLHQELVVMPPPVITKPGPKTMMVVQPMVIQPPRNTQMIAQPMIVAP